MSNFDEPELDSSPSFAAVITLTHASTDGYSTFPVEDGEGSRLPPGEIIEDGGGSHSHNFVPQKSMRTRKCSLCSVPFRDGMVCSLCRFVCHSACAVTATACQPLSPKSGMTRRTERPHHWVEVNLTQGQTCVACTQTVGRVFCGQQARLCSFCDAALHISCGLDDTIVLPPCESIYDVYRCGYSCSHLPLSNMSSHGTCTIIAIVNPASGARQGMNAMYDLQRILTPEQVYDIRKGPLIGILDHLNCENLRVLVCGGDGTAGWLMQEMHAAKLPRSPTIAVLPLGTANDLSRTLGWGSGYNGEDMAPILAKVARATSLPFNRWDVVLTDPTTGVVLPAPRGTPLVMNNYLSVGYDAEVAYLFENLRKDSPGCTSSRSGNKILYGLYGAKLQCRTFACDKKYVLKIDDNVVPIPPSVGALIVLNLQSYAAGNDLWNKRLPSGLAPASFSDGKMDVVAIKGPAHMLNILTGVSTAIRIGQGSSVSITSIGGDPFFMQCDGEAWEQPASNIHLSLDSSEIHLLKCE